MLLFCPNCGNSLVYQEGEHTNVFACRTCPYISPVYKPIRFRIYPKLKDVSEIVGGAAAWENVDSTEERCPVCSHPRAYFMQMQTRSADEPMTTFYKCCDQKCGHLWRD